MSLEGEHFGSPFLFQTLIKLFDREMKRNRLSLDKTSGQVLTEICKTPKNLTALYDEKNLKC